MEHERLRSSEDAVLWEVQEGGGDTGSELYATVEDNARPGKEFLFVETAKRAMRHVAEPNLIHRGCIT